MGPLVSVVIPLFNSEKEVPALFEQVTAQTYRPLEVILVDDGSSDGTLEAAKRTFGGLPIAKVVSTQHGGASHARNEGLRLAQGDVVFFMESDCTYESDYVTKAMEFLAAHQEVSAVCLTGAPLKLRRTLAVECVDIENKVQHRLIEEGKVKAFYAWVFRRPPLLAVGGFDEGLFQAEDKDLFRRFQQAGYKVGLVPGINWHHRRDQTLREMTAKWFSRGRMRVLYLLKHHLLGELARAMGPLLLLAAGLVTSFVYLPLGLALTVMALGAVLASSLRAVYLAWPTAERKRYFIGYPFFVLLRNLTTALGYSWALLVVATRRIQGRQVTWRDV